MAPIRGCPHWLSTGLPFVFPDLAFLDRCPRFALDGCPRLVSSFGACLGAKIVQPLTPTHRVLICLLLDGCPDLASMDVLIWLSTSRKSYFENRLFPQASPATVRLSESKCGLGRSAPINRVVRQTALGCCSQLYRRNACSGSLLSLAGDSVKICCTSRGGLGQRRVRIDVFASGASTGVLRPVPSRFCRRS